MDSFREWPAAINRSGRRFAPVAEAELDLDLRNLARKLPHASAGVDVVPEFVGPNGIADLVAVTQAGHGFESRVLAGIPYLRTITDARVVAATSVGRTVTGATIASTTGLSPRQSQTAVNRLVRDGAIRRVGSGYRRSESMVAVGRMYALEAKVSDWRKAFSQALRYSSWSDASAIVLLRSPREIDDAIELAKRFRIGLAVHDRWLVRPSIRAVPTHLRLLASDRFAFTLDLAKRTPETS